jgi:hypothetical protein
MIVRSRLTLFRRKTFELFAVAWKESRNQNTRRSIEDRLLQRVQIEAGTAVRDNGAPKHDRFPDTYFRRPAKTSAVDSILERNSYPGFIE